MELQGKQKTRDFLSLYTKESSLQQLHDSKPPAQGFFTKTHDFLQPLETAEKEKATRGAAERTTTHVLPGGIGTYSIGHVSCGVGTLAAVKPESGACGTEPPQKPEPDAAHSFPGWETAGQWPSPLAAALSPPSFGSLASSRNSSLTDKKQRFMESTSRFSKGFDEDDEDEEEFGKREGSSHKELTVKLDGKINEQKASTPRSKHSATEQRRRSKINDRFQILRGLLPNNDQKRDKASFLLEVIEYIQFLQEKLQKYELMYPGWNDETTKLMPWSNHHCSGDVMVDPQALKNGAAAGLLIPDHSISVAPSILSPVQNPTESDLIAGVSFKSMENPSGFANKIAASPASLPSNLYASVGRGTGVGQPQQRLIPESANTASQSEWLRSAFPTGCTISNGVLSEQEELAIDEGTISVSSEYSQGLLNSLSQALQNSGIDLSQASISVHINLGRRSSGNRHNASTSMGTQKEHEELLSDNLGMGSARLGSRSDESEQASKRQKSDHS
ncbi:Transcription factor BIM2 [Platanthera zijinensis]|uniref:Transcription factor BIM2 n=1 Tax=Platanthera zijinensis TaxID=2320716 RepID=A0AAP0B3G5_9ASPA